MNAYQKYRKDEPTGWSRIDLLLALYDKALERLDRAEAALAAGDPGTALPQLSKTQLIVTELASGVRVEVNPEANTNMLRLYEYVVSEITQATPAAIENARKVLRTLREGFEAVRHEANQLERTGRLPAADQLQMVLATA
ncbi:MAG: flagellar export chaperone FliS [Gemmata sp.]